MKNFIESSVTRPPYIVKENARDRTCERLKSVETVQKGVALRANWMLDGLCCSFAEDIECAC